MFELIFSNGQTQYVDFDENIEIVEMNYGMEQLYKHLSFKPFIVGITKMVPGIVLRINKEKANTIYQQKEYHLVGDVNEVLGVCEDCTYFDESAIVEWADITEIITDDINWKGRTE